MALKTKNDLKDVFSGVSSIFIKKDGYSGAITALDFDYDMPVTVDTLSFTQAEPTLNRTKVHGLQADWTVIATAGDITFSATVPTMHKDLTNWFLGGSVGSVSAVPLNGSAIETFTGDAYSLKAPKLIASVGILSEDHKKMFFIKKLAIYATPLMENASSTPFGFTLTGSIEATDDATSEDIMFLTKV